MMPIISFIIILVIIVISSGAIGAIICAKTIGAESSIRFFYLGQIVMYEDPSPEAYHRMMKKAMAKGVDVHSLYIEYKQKEAKKQVLS